jgi:suppressor of G2 allele of SKP1
MSTQAALGQKALEAKDYSGAVKHYTEALKSSNSPLWLTQRSTAYQREGAHELALHDAEDAVLSAISRGKRELIAAAQMRRAIALYSLGRYGDARLCFTWARKLNEKEKGLGMWQAKVVAEFDKLDEEAEGRKVAIKEVPDKVDRAPKQPQSEASVASENAPAADAKVPTSGRTTSTTTTAAAAQTPKDKIRHEWYQSSSKVTITIFAKNVPKDQADIQIGAQSVRVPFYHKLHPLGYMLTLPSWMSPFQQAQDAITTSHYYHFLRQLIHLKAHTP